MKSSKKIYLLFFTVLLVFFVFLIYFKVEKKPRINGSCNFSKVLELCNELRTNKRYEYKDEDIPTLKFIIKNYKPSNILFNFTETYLFNRFNKVTTIEFDPVIIEDENVNRVSEYLKGNDLWKIDISEKRNIARENRSKELIMIQELEILEFLNNKSLPKEIENILLSADFRYKVDFFMSKKNIVNRGTFEYLQLYCQNDFVKRILGKISVKEKENGGLTKTEMFFFKQYSSANFDYITGLQINDPVILICENFFIYRSELSNLVFTNDQLNILEIVFLRSITFIIDDLYITSIFNYLEIYLGIKVPDIFIDKITNRIIKNPVLLVYEENYYIDASTARNRIDEWKGRSPFTKSRIDNHILQEYASSNTYEDLNENDIEDDISNFLGDITVEVPDKCELLVSEIENFINRLPIRFKNFYIKYMEYEEFLSIPLQNFTEEFITFLL